MKKIALAVLALFGLSAFGAMAADMTFKAPPPPVVTFNWTGFYAGGNLGYGWGTSRNDWDLFAPLEFANPPASTVCAPFPGLALCIDGSDRTKLAGAIGGLQAGYNWVNRRYLFGIEGDLQYSGQKGDGIFQGNFSANAFLNSNPVPGTITSNYSESLRWLGTLRGRAGILVQDRWALYGTGGLAIGEVRVDGTTAGIMPTFFAPANCSVFNSLASTCPLGTISGRETRVGWTLGAGVENALSANWSWKVEYLHVDLGKVGTSFTTPAACIGGTSITTAGSIAFCNAYLAGRGTISSRFTDEIVRFGINYHFAGGSVAAKY